MKKLLAVALVVLLGAVFFISTVHAETTFNYGASERIRQEIWDNVIDLKTLPPTNGLLRQKFLPFQDVSLGQR